MKSLQEYLVTGKDSDEIIWKFAFLGRQETLNSKLQELSELAETENWTSSNSTKENNILYSYITHTFIVN